MTFEEIGKYAVEKANEYKRAVQEHKRLVQERHDIDQQIIDAEIKQDKDTLAKLYEEFRIIKYAQLKNRTFRQEFCDDFLSTISDMEKEMNKDE